MRDGEPASASYDAVVVGAGPAGGAAALSLARSGISVLLVDRADFPRWKVCGACLGPAATRLLDEVGLGARIREAGAVPLDTLMLHAGPRRARIELRGSKALSRGALDALLADAVLEAGGEVRLGVGVHDVRPGRDGAELRVRAEDGEETVRAGVVVDATGLGGLSLDGERPSETVADGARLGLGAVFAADVRHALPPGELRMTVAREGYAGMVRLEDGSLNVAAAVDRAVLTRDGPREVVERIVASAGGELPTAEPRLGWRGTPPLTRTPARAGRGRVLRVGDAAGYVEPFTGEGIGWAISAGLSVASFARRLLEGEGDEVAREWSRACRDGIAGGQGLCRLLATSLRRPALVELGVGLVGAMPGLARPLLRSTADVSDEVLRSARQARDRAIPSAAGSSRATTARQSVSG